MPSLTEGPGNNKVSIVAAVVTMRGTRKEKRNVGLNAHSSEVPYQEASIEVNNPVCVYRLDLDRRTSVVTLTTDIQ